jgi:asparagine synthase (glutamine-hydrolysing)
MSDAIAHRGPDDAGIENVSLPGDVHVCLGHRRLSILDLSANGHQPMGDAASGSWVVFNGEIYNHLDLRRQLAGEFRSTSDTETLLRGWVEKGPEWVRSLAGIFAFALLDARRKELWLVRDHLGVKPLYVAQPQEGLWLFASEVRALLASRLIPRQLSAEGLDSYLAFGAVQAPSTIVAGIRSLMPGERWCFSLEGDQRTLFPRASRYWRLAEQFSPEPEASGEKRRAPSLEFGSQSWQELRATWDEAIASQMISDVPVGVFLSGGIDSSSIVATLARQGHIPSTFSIVFSEQGFDESQHSDRVAQQYGTRHRAITVTPEQVLSGFNRTLAAYDQPSIDGVNSYVISQAVRQAGIKVAISGLGGDEVFGGYPTFRRLPALEKWIGILPMPVARLAASFISRDNHSGRAARLAAILRNGGSRLDTYCVLRQLFSERSRDRLLSEDVNAFCILDPDLKEELARQVQSVDAVNAVSLLELSLYMQNMLLRDTDQMSMAHALEVRVPLLDHRLVEAIARIPGSAKVLGGGHPNKWLLLKLADVSLPQKIVRRRKMGFVFPWDVWLRRELRAHTEEILMDTATVERAGLDRRAVSLLWRSYLERKDFWRYSDVLALLHLVSWVAENELGPPAPGERCRVRGESRTMEACVPLTEEVSGVRCQVSAEKQVTALPLSPLTSHLSPGKRSEVRSRGGRKRILLLIPEIAASRGGGVYQVGRSLMRLLEKEHEAGDVECRILALGRPDSGPESRHDAELWGERMRCFDGNRRLGFIQGAVFWMTSWADVVVSTHLGLSSVLGILPRTLRPTTLTFIHGIEVWRPLHWRHRTALLLSDYIVSNTRFTARKASQFNPWLGGIDCCHLGIQPGEAADSASIEKLIHLVPARHDILIASRMNKRQCEKGHRALIAAMAAVNAAVPDARLIIAGSGTDVAMYRGLAIRSPAAKRIHFTGFIPDAVLRGLYQRVGVFAMPSSQEGFGLVYAEAMAAGLPCVASTCDAAGEVIVDGETGLLVDREDPHAVAGALIRLLQDEPYRQCLGAAGRKRFEEHFTEARFHDRAWRLIEEALGVR